jgi:hypothetical protein
MSSGSLDCVITGLGVATNSSFLECTVAESAVGRALVSVEFGGLHSETNEDIFVDRMCVENRYGFPGDQCGPCPQVSESLELHVNILTASLQYWLLSCLILLPKQAQYGLCIRFFLVPVPRPGYYATALTTFVACVPPESCPGVDGGSVPASMRSLQPYFDAEVS